tara:strand:- start:73 stop:822 length:750 start_codon:yes stop_codon:yes gene_type:complete
MSEVFLDAAARYFCENPDSKTADMILLLASKVQEQLEKTTARSKPDEVSIHWNHGQRGRGRGNITMRNGEFAPIHEFVWDGNPTLPKRHHREIETDESGIFDDADEINVAMESIDLYDSDEDTKLYKNQFWEPWNNTTGVIDLTYFTPANCMGALWSNMECYNDNDRNDIEIVREILCKRMDFYNKASPNVYRCWRKATLIADCTRHLYIHELKQYGYTDEDINPLFTKKIAVFSKNSKDCFQLNPSFW